MKNFLLSLLIIPISFFCTIVVLNSLSGKEATKPASALVTDSVIEDDEGIEDTTIDSEDDDSSESMYKSFDDSEYLEITSDYKIWKTYQKENIELSTDFIPIDDLGDEITKKEFLEKLKTGKYIPTKRFEEAYMYQLYKFDTDIDEKIGKSIKSISDVAYTNFLKEGKPFPEFNFRDINGNEFSTDNTRGKLVVIMCWFVQSKTCIQEFPMLNDLYDKYEDHEDVVFLSLSFDTSSRLKSFLAKKEFRYPVIADKKDFLQEKVQAKQYPTHILVDAYGNIIKIVNNVDALALSLDTTINGDLLNDAM